MDSSPSLDRFNDVDNLIQLKFKEKKRKTLRAKETEKVYLQKGRERMDGRI